MIDELDATDRTARPAKLARGVRAEIEHVSTDTIERLLADFHALPRKTLR